MKFNGQKMAFELPKLDYDYNALEPHIDAQTMEIHHTKHHQAYINKANEALKGSSWEKTTACDILANLDEVLSDFPAEKHAAIRNNVGGHCNHTFFWLILSPHGGGKPSGALAEKIEKDFGSFKNFQEQFNTAAASRFGSGWAWLVINGGKLEVISTANQDSPRTLGYKRVLGLDVWEHAYYLNYQNRRPDYINAYWDVVNWEKANEFFEKGGV